MFQLLPDQEPRTTCILRCRWSRQVCGIGWVSCMAGRSRALSLWTACIPGCRRSQHGRETALVFCMIGRLRAPCSLCMATGFHGHVTVHRMSGYAQCCACHKIFLLYSTNMLRLAEYRGRRRVAPSLRGNLGCRSRGHHTLDHPDKT